MCRELASNAIRPATKGARGSESSHGSNLAPLKFSELLFISIFSMFAPPNARLPPWNIFAPPWYVFKFRGWLQFLLQPWTHIWKGPNYSPWGTPRIEEC